MALRRGTELTAREPDIPIVTNPDGTTRPHDCRIDGPLIIINADGTESEYFNWSSPSIERAAILRRRAEIRLVAALRWRAHQLSL
jgi:hypothetical protein